MLNFRHDHPLTPYIKAEIQHRFDHRACETIADFQMASGRAMTIHRHLKKNARQHEKDDRSPQGNRLNFVLGWDNRAKRAALEASAGQQSDQMIDSVLTSKPARTRPSMPQRCWTY